MVQKSLVEYIRTLTKQGYDARTIQNTLLRAGYSSYDIQDAFKEAQQKQVNKPLIYIFLGILGLVIIVLAALMLLGPEEVDMTLQMTTYNTRVAPGQQIIINTEITNPSGKKTDAIIDVRIQGPRNINVPSQSVSIKDKASVPITATIPEGSPIGQYMIYATLAYSGKQKTQTASFEVVQAAEEQAPTVVEYVREEQARTGQQQCPGGCDDLNPCTTDSCKNGQCIHTKITPCCGNKICEEGEQGTCADCATETIEEARSIARASPSTALRRCEDSTTPEQCIKEVATTANDKELCEQITNTEIKDACLIHFAFNGDYTVCEQIQSQLTRNSCYTLKNLARYQ